MNKLDIIEAIKRTADGNGGVAVGIIRFEAITGISPHMWRGKFWRNWNEAVEEAGLAPNRMVKGHDRTALVVSLLELARRLRRFPTYADLQMERRSNDAFASPNVFNKLGELGVRIEVLRAHRASPRAQLGHSSQAAACYERRRPPGSRPAGRPGRPKEAGAGSARPLSRAEDLTSPASRSRTGSPPGACNTFYLGGGPAGCRWSVVVNLMFEPVTCRSAEKKFNGYELPRVRFSESTLTLALSGP